MRKQLGEVMLLKIRHIFRVLFLFGMMITLHGTTFAVEQKLCTGSGIYLYEHINFEGECQKFTDDELNFQDIRFNDTVSSIKFVGSFADGSYRALLCEHQDLAGVCTPFRIDDTDLGDNAIGNDRVSSILIENTNHDSDSFRIGTYNVQMRPWVPVVTTSDCCEDISERVRKLAERIIESEYDLIILNEAFTGDGEFNSFEEVHKELPPLLKHLYPYYIEYIDGPRTLVEGLDVLQDSGLMLFSKYPFVDLPQDTYKIKDPDNLRAYSKGAAWNDVASITYTNFADGDALSEKGVAYVRIQNPYSNRFYNVVFTHLQAQHRANVRAKQLLDVKKLIEGTMLPEQIEEEDIFFLGDLNFSGNSTLPLEKRKEWNCFFGQGICDYPGTKDDIQFSEDFFQTTLKDAWEFEMLPELSELSYELRDDGGTGGLYKRPSLLWAAGDPWGAKNYPNSIAFGDIDGDGKDEFGFTRVTKDGFRFRILDDDFEELFSDVGLITDWGSDDYATSIAFGDVDGDGRDEIGITRKKGRDDRSKYWIFDDALEGFSILTEGGIGWGDDNYANSIAFGDIDGDGKDEVGFTRETHDKFRFRVLDDADEGFEELFSDVGLITDWGSDDYATSIAFGDVDGDGRDEIGITRKKGSDDRSKYWIFDDALEGFSILTEGGIGWGDDNYANSIAFGDIDGDGKDEVGFTRETHDKFRFRVLDDADEGFEELFSDVGLITDWGSDDYATSIAFGDVDGDGKDEIGVTRRKFKEVRTKYWIFDDREENYAILHEGGRHWGEDNNPTRIAFGNITNAISQDVGLARESTENNKLYILTPANLNGELPDLKRFDYILRNYPEQDKDLCVQHMTIGYNMQYGHPYREGSFGTIGNQSLSDHYALNADINRYASYCNPANAWKNPPLDAFLNGNIAHPGNAQWFRFDDPGTYSIQLKTNNPALDYQVYRSTDLSSPLPRDSASPAPFGWTHHVTNEPLYIKVYSKRLSWVGDYKIIVHKHRGNGADDARMLLPNTPNTITLPTGTQSAWFRLQTEAADSGLAQNLRFFAEHSTISNLGLSIQLRAANGNTIIAQSDIGSPQIRRTTILDNNKTMFLVIQRNDAADEEKITVGWETNLTVVYDSFENPLTLQSLAQTEPDILGDDDEISMTVYSDGNQIVDSVDLGNFDTGQVRNLSDVVPQPIRFLQEVKVRLVEDDDLLNPDDKLSALIRPRQVVDTGQDSRLVTILEEDDTDGVYDFRFNINYGSPFVAFPNTKPLRGHYHFPIITKYASPDLVVEGVSAGPGFAIVTIRNVGTRPTSPFWVDLYVDPNPVPTQVNQIWNDGRTKYGLVWGVGDPVGAGESLTLTIGDQYYWPLFSRVENNLPVGTPIYVQVDSANIETSYGGVLELHEIIGEPYNNILGPVPSIQETDVANSVYSQQAIEKRTESFLPARR